MKPRMKTFLTLLAMTGALVVFMVSTMATQKYVDVRHDSLKELVQYVKDDVSEIKKDIKKLIKRRR